ncbi:uncharacterized protein LOC136084836 [Hydra vulgaris]|uniref:Uncharacterized protein LOC136084836 n=1 Tax=Hydra vulgaris TaxID=6087 RepID=A0ABM4CJS5_HYDVU
MSKNSVAAERVVASVIANKDTSPHGTVCLSRPERIGGYPVPVLSGSSSKEKRVFNEGPELTAKDLVYVQHNAGLFNSGAKKLASTLNQVVSSLAKHLILILPKFG